MKKLFTGIIFICFSFHSFSQTFPVSGEITTTNGVGINIVSEYLQQMSGRDQSKYVKIVTTMPFQNGKGMTSLYLDYWGYEKVWRTSIGWYVYNDSFFNPSVSISGDYTHSGVILANEGGYVTISIPIPAFSHYGHLTVNSLTEIKAVTSTWADGWSIEEESTPGTTNQKTVSIQNRLSTDGDIGIGITSPTNKLHILSNASSDGVFVEGSLNPTIEVRDNTNSVRSKLNAEDTSGTVGTITAHDFHIVTGNTEKMTVTSSGNFGLGTTSIIAKMHVKHGEGSGETFSNLNGGFLIENAGSANSYYVFQTATVGGGKSFSITNAGNVGIGTDTPDEKLEVNGTIRSKKVKVEASGWPDYVFSPNFELRTLDEVENFIEKNQHLPEVPSAKEIEATGLDLGSMDATLLKKVEELTLYIIEMNNTLKEQDKRIKELEKENIELREKSKAK